mgnify:FL=1|jgi:hypothetical protein
MTEISELVINSADKNNMDYYCPICKMFLHPDKSSQTECLHIFCTECISTHLSMGDSLSKRCPICREYLVEECNELKKSNLFAYNALSNVKVKCKNNECKEELKLIDLEKHIKDCDFEKKPCLFCDDGEGYVKSELKKHISDNLGDHVMIMCDKILDLEKQIKDLRERL